MSTVTAAILTGGLSSRMGRDKADVVVYGHTMLERVVAASEEICDEVVLLGPPRTGFRAIQDAVHVGGPLAGLATVLDRVETDRVLLLAVDQPFVMATTLRALTRVEESMPVVPVDRVGTPQVTCAVYPSSISSEATTEASEGGSLQTLLDRVSFHPVTPDIWTSWGEDGRSWFSIDTDEGLTEAVERFGQPTASRESSLD